MHILGALAKFRNATISFALSLSVCMEQHGSHWTDFHEIYYVSIFRTSVHKIQVSLKSDKNMRYFTWTSMCTYDNISPNSFRIRNVSHNGCREYQYTRFIFNILFRQSCFLKRGKIWYSQAGQIWNFNPLSLEMDI